MSMDVTCIEEGKTMMPQGKSKCAIYNYKTSIKPHSRFVFFLKASFVKTIKTHSVGSCPCKALAQKHFYFLINIQTANQKP